MRRADQEGERARRGGGRRRAGHGRQESLHPLRAAQTPRQGRQMHQSQLLQTTRILYALREELLTGIHRTSRKKFLS